MESGMCVLYPGAAPEDGKEDQREQVNDENEGRDAQQGQTMNAGAALAIQEAVAEEQNEQHNQRKQIRAQEDGQPMGVRNVAPGGEHGRDADQEDEPGDKHATRGGCPEPGENQLIAAACESLDPAQRGEAGKDKAIAEERLPGRAQQQHAEIGEAVSEKRPGERKNERK